MHTLFIGAAALGLALSAPAWAAPPPLAAPAPRVEPGAPSGAGALGRCPECERSGPGASTSGYGGTLSNASPPPTESTGINPRYGRPADAGINAIPNENANIINEGTPNAPPSPPPSAPEVERAEPLIR
jgi:hypothetical protein